MPEQFLHGVEVIEIDDGTRPIQTVRSATIGLVGTAPKGPVNTPTLILGSRSEAVKIFGESMPGFTIPDALDAIFDQVGAMVVVINVADPEQHNTSINDPELKFDTDGKIELGYQNISNLTLKRASDSKIYELGKDYLLDQVKGIITRTNSIENTTKVTASYKCLDPSKVTLGDVIGGVDSSSGDYKGVQCLTSAKSEVKVQPRILIAPGFTQQKQDDLANPVVAEMLGIAERLRAVIIADCPNATKEKAISYRQDWGSPRIYCAYPWVKVYDTATENIIDQPASPRIAGLIAKSDNKRGFWWSPSNLNINGIVGISKPIDFTLGDTNSVANYLNEHEVTTIIQQDGYRVTAPHLQIISGLSCQ